MSSIRLCIVLTILSWPAVSFGQQPNLAPGYYVVIGAYAKSKETIAQNYVDRLRAEGVSSQLGFNSSRGLFFVYLNYFDNLKSSLEEMRAVRANGKFPDAWVRVVTGDISGPRLDAANNVSVPDAKEIVDQPGQTKIDSASTDSSLMPGPETHAVTDSINIATEPEENDPIQQYPVMTLGNTEVFLSLFNARNNRIVDGEVQVVDTERAKLITRVKGNEYLKLPDPKSKSGQLTLICESFGYRKIQQEINYPLPLADTVKPFIDLMGTTVVINFDLVRYYKGDIATLYNVYFFNDAALMLPESKYELNSLLQMMNENKDYRIRLHGHSNGRYTGRILTMGSDTNFFSLDGAKEGVGSAKDLSEARAGIIKSFLTSNGIDAGRIDIKAWGGRRPLYDRNGANARKNVRVEVEILED
jgi:outer membrane protein OmpA-like peptidoglycan-associated protein